MSLPDLTEAHKTLVQRVVEDFDAAHKMRHRQFCSRCDELYKLYRVYQDAKADLSQYPGRDTVPELKAEWGSDLHIPYAFANVETIVPRMLSNRPKGLMLPRDAQGARNGGNMLMVLEAQQDQVQYPLRTQTTAKTGQMYGLGVRKSTWRRVTRNVRKVGHATIPTDELEWTTRPEKRVLHDDPWTEDVDPYNFVWDPFAEDLETCEWVIHRTWRSMRYVWGKVCSGEWPMLRPKGEFTDAHAEDAYEVEKEDILGLGAGGSYSSVWAERMKAAGHDNFDGRGNQIHEVWELHDGNQVITVLDRTLPVRVIENPMWHGNLPFHIYRPTEVPHQFEGIGAIEPARFLQYEMDVLRSQRRDYAALALSPVMAMQEGTMDPSQAQWYPGAVWSTMQDPREVLKKVEIGDVPQSGYAEEDRIRSDIERATGLSDLVQGNTSSAAGTATEAQLSLAAANVRIQNMTYRFETEVIESEMNHWLEMNQEAISGQKGYAREVPAPGSPDRRYTWFEVSPDELAGQMQYRVLGGSTAPDNVPQDRQDAQTLMGVFGQDPGVDRTKVLQLALQKMGVRHPDAWLAPPQQVPATVFNYIGQALQQFGLDQATISQVFQASVAEDQRVREEQQGGQQQLPEGEPQ